SRSAAPSSPTPICRNGYASPPLSLRSTEAPPMAEASTVTRTIPRWPWVGRTDMAVLEHWDVDDGKAARMLVADFDHKAPTRRSERPRRGLSERGPPPT